MHIIQLQMLPVEVQFGDRVLKVPKMTLPEAVEWANKIGEEWVEKVTEGMEPHQKREYLNFYPPMKPDLKTLRQICPTPDGISHVLRAKLPQAGLTPEEVDQILNSMSAGVLAPLAKEIADLDEVRPTAPTGGRKVGESERDPLKSTEKQG